MTPRMSTCSARAARAAGPWSIGKNRYVLRGFTVDPRQGGNVTNRFQETTSAHRFAVFASSGRHIQRHPFGRKNTSRCVSLVAMVQAADLWERHHGAFGDGHAPVVAWARLSQARDVCARRDNTSGSRSGFVAGAAHQVRSYGPDTPAGLIRSASPRTDSARAWTDSTRPLRRPCPRLDAGTHRRSFGER